MTQENPQIIGAGGGNDGKSGGGQARTPQVSPDSLESTQYATVLDLLSEGEISGLKNGLASIYLNNTPLATILKTGTYVQSFNPTITVTTSTPHGLTTGDSIYLDFAGNLPPNGTYTVTVTSSTTFTVFSPYYSTSSGTVYICSLNFRNVTVYTRNGTQSQTYIPLDGVANTVSVGATVLQGSPVTQTITDSSVNRVKVTINVPLLQEQKTNGDVVGSTFQLRISVQYNGGGFTTVLDDTVTGRTDDPYQKDYNIPITGAFPVDIRVSRLSADTAYPPTASAFSWSSYSTIVDSKFRYPNSALVALRMDAAQFSSIPERSYLVRGIKVAIPSNATVDSTTGRLIYSGVWNGTFGAAKWCSDPAWILWDLLTSTRYGFGDHITAAQLDKWAFYSASQYCATLVPDGFGGQEPRFSCNVSIQAPEEAYTLINNLASVFRAMPYWAAGALTISQDKPTDPAYLFTLANVSEEGFSYENSSRKGRPTVAVVKYLDLASRDAAYEVAEDQTAISKYGVITTQIDAFACTSRGQASRIADWLLYSEQYENEIVTFTASIDAGVLVRPGQVIEISDPVRAGSRRGGRLTSATTSALVVDNATGLPASGGTISVILPNGTVESRTVGTRSGTTVPVTTPFTTAPNANSVWIWETNDLQASTWRVLGIQEQDGANYAISAIAYNSSKYAYVERGAPLQQRDVSNLNDLPATPTGLSLSETLYTYQSQVRAKVMARWQPVLGVNQYFVQYRKDNGNWISITVQGPDYDVLDITPGLFEFRIYALNALGKQSAAPLTGSLNALGKTAPPANVANFTHSIDPNIGVLLSWTAVSDIDLATYEIRSGGTDWASATLVTKVNATTYKVGLIAPSTTTYRIKALDTSGVYSTTAASTTVTINAVSTPAPSSSTEDVLATITWSASTASYAIAYYAIIYSGTTLAEVKTTSFSLPITWSGARSYSVKAVDIAGNQSSLGSTTITVIQAAAPPNRSATFDGPNVILKWDAVNGTTKTRAYQILDGATVIATSQTTTYTKNVDWTGSKTFTVRAVDANGNFGAEGSIVVSPTVPSVGATINQSVDDTVITLIWTSTPGNLPIRYYELRYGPTYASAAILDKVSSLTYSVVGSWLGDRRFWVTAFDTAGNQSTSIYKDVSIVAAAAPTVTSTFEGQNVLLAWNAIVGTLPTRTYEILDGATVIATAQTTKYTKTVDWQGNKTYGVRAVDINGNVGTTGSVTVTVTTPATPSITATFNGTQGVLTWPAVSASLPIAFYEVRYGASFDAGVSLGKVNATTFATPVSWSGARVFWVRPTDTAGNLGTAGTVTLTTVAATAPTVASTFANNLLTLTWNAVAGSVPTTDYKIYQVNAGSDVLVDTSKTTTFSIAPTWTGEKIFRVRAVGSNEELGALGSVTTTLVLPSIAQTNSAFKGEQVELSWTPTVGSLDIATYKIFQSETFDPAATPIAETQSTTYKIKVTWVGSRRFWIQPIDSRGNAGTQSSVQVTITAPGTPSITQQVIDNNVLLRWNDVTTSLPIVYYEVKRGATWETATSIGTKQGLFTTVFETVAGTYTYWLAGVDTAGNYGTPSSVSAEVNQPPDYILKSDYNSTFTGTKTSAYASDGKLIVPVNTTETWQSHFTSRSWTTPQAQITAGFPYYAMPSTNSASYVEEIDYGTTITNTKVTSTLSTTTVAGATSITPALRTRGTTSTAATYSQTGTTITVTSAAHGLSMGDYVYLSFTSGTATTATYVVATAASGSFTVTSTTSTTTSGNVNWTKWTNYAGLNQVFAASFRYLQVQYDFASSGGDDLLRVDSLNVRLDVKIRNDAGTGNAVSTDSGGTVVNFTVPFVDVEGLSVTPSGTTPRIAIYDFVDAPNPTSFKVLLFDLSGNRVSGPFSWTARGT
jgi:predicted phage tail protein